MQMLHPTHDKPTFRLEGELRCRHCGSALAVALDEPYCCHGCRSAHALIERFELNRFYEIVQDNIDAVRPVSVQRIDYKIFDSPDFQKDFVSPAPEGQQTAHFYLGNMSCYACVWVCETIARRLDPEAHLAINLGTGEASLTFDPQRHELSHFLQHFEALGYGVSPQRGASSDNRRELARIGVSLFCLMNIMMLAFPEYLSPSTLEDSFRDLFRWIALGLATISIFYSGWPLLKGSWNALREGQLHLDLPIGLGIISTYVYSVVNTWRGHPHVFFDTGTAVVSLLLVGRFVQKQALARIAREQNPFLEGDYRIARVTQADGSEQLKPLHEICRGDTLRLLPGEVVPLDCELLSPHAELHYGLLTGESQLQAISEGAELRAGAVNGSRGITVRAEQSGVESYLLRLQRAAESLHQQKGHYMVQSEKLARGFVGFVLLVAVATLILTSRLGGTIALERFVAVLLVACPCIFGFGAPLVIARGFQLGMQRGVLFRSQRALEGLCEVRDFYFDKTGTLTEDESRIARAEWNETTLRQLSKPAIEELLRHLPSLSRHHVGAALARWVGGAPAAPAPRIKALREFIGQGLSLVWEGHEIRLGRYSFCFEREPAAASELELSYLCIDGQKLLSFTLEESLRPDAREVFTALQQAGRRLWMLTGDGRRRALGIAQALGLPAGQIATDLSPRGKEQLIGEAAASAMVGNGINDALALSKVAIGIALSNATDALKDQADLQLQDEGLRPLLRALDVSRATRRALQRCFAFALLFNFIGVGLAVSGTVTPVIAAILMPISSLSIFALASRWSPVSPGGAL